MGGDRMKVMLVKPKIKFDDRGNVLPPLGLAYLAAVLEKNGYDVRIIDAPALDISAKNFKRILLSENPDIVGISCNTPEVFSAFEYADLVKEILPKSTVILGGPHPSALPKETLFENKNIDFVIIGEGEKNIISVVRAIENESSLKHIRGIAYRSEDQIVITPPSIPVEDIDTLPIPAYHLLPIDKYVFRQKGWGDIKHAIIITTRGCPYSCTYCSHAVFGRKIRMRSSENVLDEIEYLYNNFGVRSLVFVDDTFTIDRNRVKKICEGIAEKALDLKWSCWTNVNTIGEDIDMLKQMKKAGCMRISYGVETGDPELLKQIKKPITLEKVGETFELTKRAGLETLAYFMIGLPGETKASIKKTKEFVKKINPDYISVTILCPLPGSDLYKEYGKRLPKEWIRYQMIPFDYLPVIQLGDLNFEELARELKNFYKEFYASPRFLFSKIRDIRSFNDIVFYAKKGFSVAKKWM